MTTKTELKHTPGPWKEFGLAYLQTQGIEIVNDNHSEIIAYVVEQKNARLIAAAPELKKQLEDTAMEYHQNICGTLRLFNCQSPLCVRNKAAIAKAEGR